LKQGDQFGDLEIDRKIVLKWILEIQDVRTWTRFT